MMRFVCDCGSVCEFDGFNEDTQQNNQYNESIGATYHTVEGITFWLADHEALGITCHKCNKSAWIFI